MNAHTSLKKNFLIAMPGMDDETFAKSVVYLYEHSEHGAMGIIINKPSPIDLGQILDHLGIPVPDAPQITSRKVLMGGPDGHEHGMIVYPKTRQSRELTLCSSKETLIKIAEGEGPQNFLITLGYASWGPGQLERELRRNNWLVAPMDDEILFHVDLNDRWQLAARHMGIRMEQVSHLVGHA